jgi:ketopantoate reductase
MITVYGAGAIGGTTGAALARAGYDVDAAPEARQLVARPLLAS